MADGPQSATLQDDELDFRPLAGQPTPGKPAAQARPAAVSDGIDFQPATATSRTLRAVSQATDELDFRPAEKPATLSGVFEGQQPGPTLTERAARLGRGSLSSTLTPPPADTTKIPRNVFTGGAQGAGMATEEETQKNGVLRAAEPVTLPGPHGVPIHLTPQDEVQMAKSVLPGLDKGFLVHQPGMENDTRLLSFENALMNEKQQKEHPILTGASEFASGLTAPTNLGLIVATAGAEGLAGPAAQTVKRLIAAGFTAQMLGGAIQQVPEIADAVHRGDFYNAKRLMTHMVLSAGMAGLAARGTFEEPPPLTVPRGTISAPLAMDAAIERGGRRMQDFEANAAARVGMARQAGAESGIEAAKQARINEPVKVPKTYEGEPPILPGRRQGPERNPLETEAAHVREERESQQPDFRVMDLRRVTPEEPGQAPYYEIAPVEPKPSRRIVEPAPPGETVGARGRSAAVSKLAERILPDSEKSLVERSGVPYGQRVAQLSANRLRNPVEREYAMSYLKARLQGDAAPERSDSITPNRANSLRSRVDSELARTAPQALTEKYSPDTIETARQELQQAYNMASQFERPGRYQSVFTNAQGFEEGGTWYGITSNRDITAHQFPWYKEITQGPDKIGELIKKGKGAEYERLLGTIAESIEREKASAAPVMAEFAPRLRELAERIDGNDQELSDSLAQLANADGRGFQNLREYIQRKVQDAEQAQSFFAAIDDAAAEARESAGAEETPGPGSEARGEEGRGEEAARQPAGSIASPRHDGIDFEPLPEPQPINPQEVEDLSRQLGRPITAEEIPGIRRRLAAERNIEAGLRGERRDVAGEIREEHRAKLERGEILPGMEAAVREQREAAATEQGRRLTEESNRPPESIEETAGKMERESPLFRGTAASPQKEIFNQSALEAAKDATAQKPKVSGTTLYSNAFLDPAAWREAFPGAIKALVRFGDTTLSTGDIMRGILREQTGELVRRKEQLYKALEAKANEWDARPAKEQLDFILREQHGQKQVNAADQTIADKLRQMFAERREQIENLGHGAFQRWRENYFPQMWERPNQVRDWITQVLAGKRRMEGPASFKKQRVFDDIQEGIDAGFKPLTTNPITLALAKLHEMDRYALAHTTLDSMKKAGLAKAVMVGQEAPAGWERLSEGIGTIYGGGDIPVKEAYDKAVWDRLSEVAKNLGIKHERAVGIGGTRMGYATPGKITTRFATPESVIAHEIGHNLDWKYGLKDQLVKNKLYAKELRALADLHIEGMEPAEVPQSFQRYIRKGEEKMATMVEALIHAPDKFREVAPNTWDFLQKFIADRPELKPLIEAKPSLRYDTRTSPVSAGGIVIHGYYYAPKEAALVFNNYLSPGLQRFKTYNAVRMVGNTLNQAQLGLSAFHLGFTSIDASVSDMALALERLSRGEVARAMTPAMRSVSVLGSPINTLFKGNKLLREYMEPGKFAEMSRLADAVAQAGGRVHMDPYYKNQAIESFWKAWKEGSYAKAGLRAFPAAMEYAAKPVMEYAVPRMKLGVFANVAEDVLARSDRENWKPEKTRYELNRAWDSVDNRMGQIVYDNLFWNRAVKDLGLVSVRSLGWNLGTAREIGGGAVDTARQLARVAAGEKAELTHRMAYVMALPIVVGFTGALVHYLSTGKEPETLTDYYFPQTGKIGPNGRPERLSLPSYVKDIVELNQHPARTVLNKVHPAITATAQFLRNEDYYGTEIHHSDDPFLRQRLDDAEFIAKQFLPFSIRNAYQRAESAGGTGVAGPVEKRSLAGTAESMIGLVPAPRSLMETAAERMAHEAAVRNMPQGPRTREQFEHSVLLRSYQNRIRSGEMKLGDLRDEIVAGRITVHDAEKIARAARSNPLEQDFARLSLADALNAWNVATPEERKQLRPELFRKGAQLKNMPADERQVFEKRLREALRGEAQPTPSANFWDGALGVLHEQR